MESAKNSKQSCWQVVAVEAEKRNEQKPGRGNGMRIIISWKNLMGHRRG